MESGRWVAAVPFAVLGAGCVVAGGLVSAATAAVPSEHASWAVAYLVLVAGVAQAALGLGQAVLATRLPARGLVVTQVAVWNAGNAAVLVGTLTGLTPVVDLGGALLVVGLLLWAGGVRGARGRGGARWQVSTLAGFRVLLLVLLVSIPTGLVLARVMPA